MENFLSKPLAQFSDAELLGLLEFISDEVKNRNSIIRGPLNDLNKKPTSAHVQNLVSMLHDLVNKPTKP